MPASIGVNLRVTGHCSQGGRKYMEDLFSVAYQQTEDERDLEYAFFGIYDGHGGSEAAAFAKEHLMDSIVKQRQFWSDNDEDVLKAIRNGYMLTHLNMWKELEKWPKTVTGLPSTAGTTASVAFIRRGKIYIGHVGDSAIVLGYQKEGSEEWVAKPLTSDHKPESTAEIERIQRCGGKVISKAGVPRVVWNRPRLGHKGPIKKNTPMDEIPFLAVARSLGDLWSYNPQNDEFIVSPDPDVGVLTIDPTKFRCLIFGTDGLWNMISPEGAVSLVQATERHNEAALVGGATTQPRDWLNPSKSLVDHALERWSNTRMRADNTSVVTLMLDPPGPPRATVLRSRTTQRPQSTVPTAPATITQAGQTNPINPEEKLETPVEADQRHVPQNGLTIMTRYSDVDKTATGTEQPEIRKAPLPPCDTINGRLSVAPPEGTPKETENDDDSITNYGNPSESYFMARLLNRSRVINTLSEVYDEIVNGRASKASSETREISPHDTSTCITDTSDTEKVTEKEADVSVENVEETEKDKDDVSIQINEVSSSSPTEGPPRPRGRKNKDAKKDAATPANDRVLRSHHETETPQRPQTRQVATRGRGTAQPSPTLHRVVILSRRAPNVPQNTQTAPLVRVDRPPPRKAPQPPEATPVERAHATRSASTAPAPAVLSTPLAQKITRSISNVARELRAGNSARAPGPARRAPAARREPSLGCKENLGAARRRARARAAGLAPPRPSRPPRASSPAEVHSTTGDAPCAQAAAPPERPRALRSRNDAEAVGGKRARAEPLPAPTAKTPKLSAERVCRALGKRASGPWAPALALRNRLRKRLAK